MTPVHTSNWWFRGWATVWSLMCLGALLVLYAVAVGTNAGQVADVVVYRWSHPLNQGGEMSGAIRSYLHFALLAVFLVLAVMAVRARRWYSLIAGFLVVGLTPLTSHVLRDVVFERPYLGDHAFVMNTLPSGHVSLSAALAVAIVLLWPTRARWPIVAAAGVMIVASLASVIAHAHRPSDVVASVLLTGAIAYAALAVFGPRAAPLSIRQSRHRSAAEAAAPLQLEP